MPKRFALFLAGLLWFALLYIVALAFTKPPPWVIVLGVLGAIGISVAQDVALYFRSPRHR